MKSHLWEEVRKKKKEKRVRNMASLSTDCPPYSQITRSRVNVEPAQLPRLANVDRAQILAVVALVVRADGAGRHAAVSVRVRVHGRRVLVVFGIGPGKLGGAILAVDIVADEIDYKRSAFKGVCVCRNVGARSIDDWGCQHGAGLEQKRQRRN